MTRKLTVFVLATLVTISLTGCHFHVSVHASPGGTTHVTAKPLAGLTGDAVEFRAATGQEAAR